MGIAVISLALALGLNTTTYAVLDAFMHPYAPFREPQRLVSIYPEGDQKEVRISWAERDAMLKNRLARLSDSIAFSRARPGRIQTGQFDEDGFITEITPNYLSVVGMTPELGRLLTSETVEPLVAVSHAFWLRALGGTRDLRDVSINVDGKTYLVAAVMPMDPNRQSLLDQIWLPRPASEFRSGWFAGRATPVIRMRAGVELADVQASFNQLAKSLEKQYGIVGTWPFRYRTESLQPDPFALSGFHRAMAASALAILLIACANLANLMTARGVARRRELALRLAIGARRSTLVRQLMIESALLAAVGGALGIIAALWGVDLVKLAMPHMEFFPLREPRVSWRLFAFGTLATALTVVLFGLVPALRASDVNVAEPLKEGSGTATGRVRRYSILAMGQVALALILVVSAAVLAKSAYHLARFSFGFNPHGLYRLYASLPRDRPLDSASIFFTRLLDAAKGVPGVQSVATISEPGTAGGVAISDFEGDTLAMIMLRTYRQVSPNFLSTLGLAVRTGRDFLPGDEEAGGAAIVNDTVARVLWPGKDPVGRMIKLGNARSSMPWVRVVGVVNPATFRPLTDVEADLPQQPEVYVIGPVDNTRTRALAFRTAASDSVTPTRLMRAVKEAGSYRQSAYVLPWSHNFDAYLGSVKFATRVFLLLASCGLGLAAVGLYGVVTYGVNRRMREFGVRIALGATGENLGRMIMHDVAVMYLAGTAVGAFAAMAAARFMETLLYSVTATDVWSLVLAELVLCAVAFLACLTPTLRAIRADPMEILRAT